MLNIQRSMVVGALFLASGFFVGAEAQAADGAQVYEFYCAQCHGVTGKGDGPNVTKSMPVTPRNFTKPEDMEKLSDDDLRGVIKDGGPALSKSPIMPPWSKSLTDDEVEAMVAHLRTLCNCKGKQ